MDFRILGPLEVWDSGRPLALGGPRPRALLAILLTQANRAVPSERLIELLWAERPPKTADATLQVYISSLRKALNPSNRSASVHKLLVSQPGGYMIRIDPTQLDVFRFERLAADGRRALAAAELGTAAKRLNQALDVWRGQPLAEFGEQPWATAEANRLEESRIGVTEDRIDVDLALGRHREVTGELSTLVKNHPERERLVRQLMLALYRADRQSEVSDVYQHVREALAEKVGMDPSTEVQKLLKQILNQDPALDLKVAERTNLPKQLTTFVGRGRDIDEAKGLLAKSRLVTLTGSGGIGKTRLALEVANQLISEYEDGVWLVELGPLTDPELVPRTAMTVLGFRDRRGQSSLDILVDGLAPKHMLIVFDNCEHVVDAVARLIEPLLEACGRLHVLTTSRELLGIRGEQSWRVAALQVPAVGKSYSPEELERYESIVLFADRASTAVGSFRVTNETAPAVSDVCQKLDGIPLAIELAAARLTILSLPQVRDRLNDRFGLLAGGSRTGLPRHQTLRAAIDWSYQLLAPAEQALLCRLSVFSGGCSFDGVEAVCVGGQVARDSLLEPLSGLVHKSLLVFEHSPVVQRYRLLDTIRDFARQQLQAAEEAEKWGNRHFEWCLALTIQAASDLKGRDQIVALERLDTENDNVRAAIDWGCAHQDPRVLVMVSSLDYFWNMRGLLREGYDKVRLALSIASPSTLERAEALTHASRLAAHSAGDYATARELALESLRIHQELGAKEGLGFTLMCIGGTEIALGDISQGLQWLKQAEVACRDQGELWPLAMTLNDYGLMRHSAGERGSGPRKMLEESVAILRTLGDDWFLSSALDSLGQIELDRDRPELATRCWIECGRIALKLADPLSGALSLDGIAKVAIKQGAFEKGLRLHAVASRLRREGGHTLLPSDQRFVDVSVTAARHGLDPRHADAIWEEGGRLNLYEGIDYALAEDPAGTTATIGL